MSDALYTVRLYWDGRKGCARMAGKRIELTACPNVLVNLRLQAIDYAPEARTLELQELGAARREMYPHECDEVLRWLGAIHER